MNTRELPLLTFADASDMLDGASEKQICDKTVLVRLDRNTIGVRLYATTIIEVHSCGNYTLYAGGHRTRLTANRINALTPIGIHTRKGEWHIGDHKFVDGIIVSPAGKVV